MEQHKTIVTPVCWWWSYQGRALTDISELYLNCIRFSRLRQNKKVHDSSALEIQLPSE